MKAFFLMFVLLATTNSFCCNCLSFNQAMNKAKKENKFIIAQFSNTLNVKDFDAKVFYLDELSESENDIFNSFVYLCLPNIKDNKEYYEKYKIKDFDSLLILDLNGIVVYQFTLDEYYLKDFMDVFYKLSKPVEKIEFINWKKDSPKKIIAKSFKNAEMYSSICIGNKFESSNYIDVICKFWLDLSESEKQKIELLKLYKFLGTKNYPIIKETIDSIEKKTLYAENIKLFEFFKNNSDETFKVSYKTSN